MYIEINIKFKDFEGCDKKKKKYSNSTLSQIKLVHLCQSLSKLNIWKHALWIRFKSCYIRSLYINTLYIAFVLFVLYINEE